MRKMRIRIIGACLLLLASSCGDGKKDRNLSGKPVEEIDSLAAVPDTMRAEVPDEEQDVPAAADESFADFFYNFATDEKLQLSRVVFPLPYYTTDGKQRIEKKDWVHDPLFSQEDSYTVLFDTPDDMEVEKDTTATSVKVEWIYLTAGKIKRYYFERLKGRWKLEAIDYADMPKADEDKEDFFEFYARFASDSLFQRSRLHDPLKFVTADPDDEFQVLETTMEPGQWFAFQPVLPREKLTNVNYGQRVNQDSDTKVMEMKGFGNGFNNTLYFERRRGSWKLMQFEDLSD